MNVRDAHLRKFGLALYFTFAALPMALFVAPSIRNSYLVLSSFALLFLTGAAVLFRFDYDRLAYTIPIAGYSVYVTPTIASGVFHGNDSWKYIRSAQLIASDGWNPVGSPFPHVHQFPGIQFLTVIVTDLSGIDIITIARFITPFMVATVLLMVVVMVRHLGASHSEAALAALLTAAYYNLTAILNYHHALAGYVLTFLLIALSFRFIYTINRVWSVPFAIAFVALLISHQYSTFVILLILAGLVTISLYSDRERTILYPRQRADVLGMLLIPGMLSAAYYIYTGQEFLEMFAGLAAVGISPSTSPPDPFLVERLVLLSEPSALEAFVFSRHIQMSAVLGVSVLIIGAKWYSEDVTRSDIILPMVLVIALAVFGVMAIVGQFVEFISSLTRNLRYAIPLIIVLVIGIASRTTRSHRSVRPLLAGVVCVFIMLSVSMYPGYLVGDGTAQYENSYSIEMTGDHQATLDFIATHRDSESVIYADTQSRFYFYLYDGTSAIETPYAYAGRIDQEGYVISRKRHEQILFIRGQDHQYRVPASMRGQYDAHWTKPYSAGDSALYQVAENDSIAIDRPEQ